VISERFIKQKLKRLVDPPKYRDSLTFENRLKLRSQKELSVAEAEFTAIRADQYRMEPFPGHFDLHHLQAIHFQLFQDVYHWAGCCRAYDIKKGDSIFCPAKDLQKHASRVFADLASEDWLDNLSIEQFIPRIAHYYTLTNKLHPFPEGNGRAQRLFFEHLAAANNYRISWKATYSWEIVETAKQSFLGRVEPTIYMFENIVGPWEENSDPTWFSDRPTCLPEYHSFGFEQRKTRSSE